VSDEEVRTCFEDAEEWSPDAGAAGSTPAPPQPIMLQLGSDVEIANCVAQDLCRQRGSVIFSEGHFWYYGETHWRRIEDHELRRAVHTYDGASYPSGQSFARVRLGKTRIDSVLREMTAVLEHPNFFAEAPVGINCASGFIAFSSDGTPNLEPHDLDHRCRHVLKGRWDLRGRWDEASPADAEEVYGLSKALGMRLTRLLEGIFLGDADAAQKRQLLAEIAGAAALGYGTKLSQPKAVILEGRTAENGKSQVLDLFRGLLPPDAVASIPAAKMTDDRFVVQLVGKYLNASDELSGAEAIAGDMFKAVVTGEPVTGREMYRSAATFRPVAQNVFATNALPSFKGGMDKGVQRRLLVLTFNRTIPEEEREENIGRHIAEKEADMLLMWAVAGASQLIRQRGFTIPDSSKTALREWLLGADPVLAWIEACVEEVEPGSPDAANAMVTSAHAHGAFIQWARREGYREQTLPAINGFVQRLRANRPAIGHKHKREGNVLTGFRIVSKEDEADPADLF
jgi:P4 family phage/plasmid primase-like protien